MASEAKHTITPAGVIAYGTPRDDGTERPWFAIHIDEWERQGGNRPSTVLHVGDYVVVTSGPSYEFHGTDKSDAELIVTAVNERATLTAERDAALVAVEEANAKIAELEAQIVKVTDPAYIEEALEKSAAASGTCILDKAARDALIDAHAYVIDGIIASEQCCDEFPGYEEKAVKHIARLKDLRERLFSAITNTGVGNA